MRNWEEEIYELNRLINVEKVSYEEIGRKYGCSGTNIKKVAKKFDITLPSKRTINPSETFNKGKGKKYICLNCGKDFNPWEDGKSCKKFCCHKCSSDYRHNEVYKNFLKGGSYYMRANWDASIFKKEFLQEQNGVCAICGCKPEHNGQQLVFILDHIDGDASNNDRNNLRLVCPNCDSQLPTYKSKNKNSARYQYRYGNRDKIRELQKQIQNIN